MNTVKAIELFAGAGGLGMGVSHAGFETAGERSVRETLSRFQKPVASRVSVAFSSISVLSSASS